MTDVRHCLLNIRKGPRADHMVHSLTLRGVLDRVGDCACGRLQLLHSRVDVDLAVQGEYRRIKRLDTGQRIHFEYYGFGYFRKCRLTHSAELKLSLERYRVVPVGAELDTREYTHALDGHVETLRARRNLNVTAFQADGEFPARVIREDTFVDIGNGLAPTVEELHGVIAARDPGN